MGVFHRLDNPTAPTAAADFDAFVAAFAGGIDGLWARTVSEVAVVAGVTTYGLSARTFRDRVIDTGQRGGVSLGDTSFADYAMANYGGWWTNKRMPAADSSSSSAGDLVPEGPVGDGRFRWDANRCVSALEHDQH